MTEITEQTLFKWLYKDRTTTFQGTKWPVNARQWTPTVKNPSLCVRGWHLSTYTGIPEFARTDCELWIAVGRGAFTGHDDGKVAYESVKLVKKIGLLDHLTVVHWAADCAERVLPLYEAKFPDNQAPRLAIQAARDFAGGLIDKSAATRAYTAARAAAYAARADAARAYATRAYTAARAAAYAAAGAAAGAAYAAASAAYAAGAADAARQTECKWQSSRLLQLMGNV